MLLNHHQKLTVILVLTLQLWNESAALSYIRSDRSIPHTSVRFTAPLLEEGFPPAVNEYKSGENKKKPLLLYLPGAYNIYIKNLTCICRLSFHIPPINTSCTHL